MWVFSILFDHFLFFSQSQKYNIVDLNAEVYFVKSVIFGDFEEKYSKLVTLSDYSLYCSMHPLTLPSLPVNYSALSSKPVYLIWYCNIAAN